MPRLLSPMAGSIARYIHFKNRKLVTHMCECEHPRRCCLKDSPAAKTSAELPIEGLVLDSPILSAVAKQLIDMAKTGLNFTFNSSTLTDLARTVTATSAENAYLKRLISALKPAEEIVAIRAENVSIAFGPANEYTLLMPITSSSHKQSLVATFTAAAEQLLTSLEPDSAQSVFPFTHLND